MEGKETGTNDIFNKPSFDGRLQYLKELEAILFYIRSAQVTDDLNRWIESLWILYPLVNPFIRSKDSELIKEKLIKAENTIIYLGNSNTSPSNKFNITRHIKMELREITIDLYKYCKHLLLPANSEVIDDIEIDNFLRQCG